MELFKLPKSKKPDSKIELDRYRVRLVRLERKAAAGEASIMDLEDLVRVQARVAELERKAREAWRKTFGS